jgi:hypothetical protein
MRTSIGNTIVAFSAVCLSGAILQAETYNLKVTVPFAFQANESSLPAGTYMVAGNATGTVTSLRNMDTSKAIFLYGVQPTLGGRKAPQLVFHGYGEKHFLAEIWSGGEGKHVTANREEKALVKAAREREISAVFP